MVKRLFRSKSALNFITSSAYQVINTGLGLVLPYLFIMEFGSETNGVLNSIAQLFVYINLLEAGVGGATLQALYKPIKEGDRDGMSRIMSATNRYYFRTGCIYAAIVAGFAVIYPQLVVTALPKSVIFWVIMIEGAGSVWRFFFQAKYILLLRADGAAYVVNLTMLLASVLRNAGKIVAISLGYDVVAVQIVTFVVSVLQSALIVGYVKKRYGFLDLRSEPDFDAISQKNSVMIQKIVWLVFNHTDVLLLSVLVGDFKLVSVYSIYSLVFEAIQSLIDNISKSLQYRLGQSWHTSLDEMRGYTRRYEKLNIGLSFALLSVAYILLPSFMKLYVGGAKDIDYLIRYVPELFLTMKVLYILRLYNTQIVEAVGHFRATQHIAVAEMVINLTVSILLARPLQIYGVLIGTICALLYSSCVYAGYVNRKLLRRRNRDAVLCPAANMAAVLVICIAGRSLLPEISSAVQFVVWAVPTTICALALEGAVNVCVFKFENRISRDEETI